MVLALRYMAEPDLSVDALKQLLEIRYAAQDGISILSDSSASTVSIISLRTKSRKLLIDIIGFVAEKIEFLEIYIPDTHKPMTPADLYKFNNDQFAIPPIRQVINVLNGLEESLDLTCYRLDEANLYLTCEALVGPPASPIVTANLSKCPFQKYACITLSKFIEQSVLKVLNLSGCLIGPEGIQILSEGIEAASELSELNISDCNLRDAGGISIAIALTFNETIKKLNLSRNKLHTGAAIELGKMLKANNTIEVINLSRNDLYPATGAVKLLLGMRRNKSLEEVDLSWNGFCDLRVCNAIAGIIKRHKKLLIINLEYNCFRDEGMTVIIQSSKNSKLLEEIYLGGNYWSDLTMKLFVTPPFKNLKILSYGQYFYLPIDVHNQAVLVQRFNPNLKVLYKDKVLPNPPEEINFSQIVLDRCKFLAMKPKKKSLKRDMGHFMLELRDNEKKLLTLTEFTELLKKFKAKLDDDLIEHLKVSFTIKTKVGKRKVKRVNIKEMADMYLVKYPTAPPPPPKPKRERKAKSPKKKK